jgi:hypothetical protein
MCGQQVSVSSHGIRLEWGMWSVSSAGLWARSSRVLDTQGDQDVNMLFPSDWGEGQQGTHPSPGQV